MVLPSNSLNPSDALFAKDAYTETVVWTTDIESRPVELGLAKETRWLFA